MRNVRRVALAAALAAGCATANPGHEAVIALLGIDPGDVVWDFGAGDRSFSARLAEAVGGNGRVLTGDPDADGVVDLLFVHGAYRRISDRSTFFRERALSVLVPNGRVAIVEPDGTPDEIAREMADAGFELVVRHDLLPRQSFQIFRPDDGTGE